VIVAALTASGGRPKQLAMCRDMMARQVFDERIVHVVSEYEFLSVAEHLDVVIEQAQRSYAPDFFVVVEDDDHYPKTYVALMVSKLRDAEVDFVGAAQTRYYHVPSGGFRVIDHPGRSSLCATAFSARAAPLMRSVLRSAGADPFVDRALWNEVARAPHFLWQGATMTGIKGLPGRQGAGSGHEETFYDRHDDNLMAQLRAWVGDRAADLYLMMRVETMNLRSTS